MLITPCLRKESLKPRKWCSDIFSPDVLGHARDAQATHLIARGAGREESLLQVAASQLKMNPVPKAEAGSGYEDILQRLSQGTWHF